MLLLELRGPHVLVDPDRPSRTSAHVQNQHPNISKVGFLSFSHTKHTLNTSFQDSPLPPPPPASPMRDACPCAGRRGRNRRCRCLDASVNNYTCLLSWQILALKGCTKGPQTWVMRKVVDSSASEDFLWDRLGARSYSSQPKQAGGQQFVHRSRHISGRHIQPFSAAANEWRSVGERSLKVIYCHEGGSSSTRIWRNRRETRVRTCSAPLRGKKENMRLKTIRTISECSVWALVS